MGSEKIRPGHLRFLERAAPQVAVRSVRREGNQLRVVIRPPGRGEKILIAIWRTRVTPRGVEEAARELNRRSGGKQRFPLVVSDYVSVPAAKAFEQVGLSYVDETGNCRLDLGDFFVERRFEKPKLERREARSFGYPKARRIVLALLEKPKGPWTLAELVRATGVSSAMPYKVWLRLNEYRLVEPAPKSKGAPFRARPFRLRDPGQLLDMLAADYRSAIAKGRRWYSLEKDKTALMKEIAKAAERSAFTGYAAASLLAPYARFETIEAYVEDPERVARKLDLRPAETGSNVVLAEPDDSWILESAKRVSGIPVANPGIVYLDLMTTPGRAKEQAQVLRESVLGY